MAEKPKIVTLCGSSRFVDIMAVCAWLLERDEGKIAQTLHLLPGWYCAEHIPGHLAEHEGCAGAMDALHFRKIEMSDEIFVVNREDYIGESTSNEIAHAQALGKPIRWYTHDQIGQAVEELLVAAIERAQPSGSGPTP